MSDEFHSLSPRGKLRRLRVLAETALAQYDRSIVGDAPVLDYHGFETNLFYRVRSAESERSWMLRLATPGWRTLENLQSEALWLEALDRDGFTVPTIARRTDGVSVAPVSVPSVPNPWNVTLFSWVPGRLLGTALSAANLAKMGELFGRLHVHGRNWSRPASFSDHRFNRWISRGETDALLAPEIVAAYPDGLEATVDRLGKRVNAAYEALPESDLRVIHCDLWHDNIKVHRGRLIPFDFEDTVLGYRIHDIAMAMLDLLEDTDDRRYVMLLAAFREGYESVLPWPDGELEIFQVGRILWQLNWVARNRSGLIAEASRRLGAVLERYERSGTISFSPDQP